MYRHNAHIAGQAGGDEFEQLGARNDYVLARRVQTAERKVGRLYFFQIAVDQHVAAFPLEGELDAFGRVGRVDDVLGPVGQLQGYFYFKFVLAVERQQEPE